MKKQILNLGKALNKGEQRSINGGGFNPCPCTNDYEVHMDGSCSYVAGGTSWGDPFSGGRCLGSVQNGLCCV